MTAIKRFFTGLAAIGLVAVIVPAAAAQTVSAGDPASVAAALQQRGLKTEITQDDRGFPRIMSSSRGVNWSVYFFGCEDGGANCTSIQFGSGFNTPAPVPLEQVNTWNRQRRYGKVYLGEVQGIFIEYDVEMGGGLTPANMQEVLTNWDGILALFLDYINWGR